MDDARRQVADPEDAEAVARRAIALLAVRPREDMVAVARIQWDLLAMSYTSTLWAAASVISGGCSDDGFEYFRAWSMTRGREVFERAVADPDTLADLPIVRAMVEGGRYGLECEEMRIIGWHAHIAATGEELPESAEAGVRHPWPSLEDRWRSDDLAELQRRLPRLAVLFGY